MLSLLLILSIVSPLIYGKDPDVQHDTCSKSCWNPTRLKRPENCPRFMTRNLKILCWARFCELCDEMFPNLYTNYYEAWGYKFKPQNPPESINFEVGESSTQEDSNWEDTSHITSQLQTLILTGK